MDTRTWRNRFSGTVYGWWLADRDGRLDGVQPVWADGLIRRRFAQIYALQRSIKRLLPEQISWLSNGFKSRPWQHNSLLLAVMATGFLRGLLPPRWLLACVLGWTAGEGNNEGWEIGEKALGKMGLSGKWNTPWKVFQAAGNKTSWDPNIAFVHLADNVGP